MTPARMPSSLAVAGDGPTLPSQWEERLIGTVAAAQTGGAFTLAELVAEPGWRRDTYVHHEADECFIVLEGLVAVRLDDQDEPLTATAGAVLYVPRGVARSLHNPGPDAARLLLIHTPGHGPGPDITVGVERVSS
jgi:mannose-6-phosphate isomerase-like protein (cupin superfamily)